MQIDKIEIEHFTFNLAGEYLKRTGIHLRHHRVLCGVQHYQVL